jgi:riboflavin kinase/FMN adenylyltransferase
MEIYHSFQHTNCSQPTVLALGNFDGIHLGHREIIQRTVTKAGEMGLKSGIFTFANHPRNVIMNEEFTKNIIYFEEKAEIIRKLGVDYLFNITFDETIMAMNPREFVKGLLLDKMNMKYGLCGFNYHFGNKALGTTEELRKMSHELGYEIEVVDPVLIDGQVVSSRLIRDIISSGKVDLCLKYLGRPYAVNGEVVIGNRLGKSLGFPTSNLMIDENMVSPANGVYLTWCTYNGITYPSITNVGNKPTIGEFVKNVETHIFDFDKELYGKRIHVEFLVKTRDEMKFDSVAELSAQIKRDCIAAKSYFSK